MLRREALTSHLLAFAASIEDDRVLSIELVLTALADVANSAMFGAFGATALIGMVEVHRPDKRKMWHEAQLCGIYVSPAARELGVGAALGGRFRNVPIIPAPGEVVRKVSRGARCGDSS